jgi:hypothetical protein
MTDLPIDTGNGCNQFGFDIRRRGDEAMHSAEVDDT